MEFIGYTTKDRIRGPFAARNMRLALADFTNHLETRRGERVMMPDFGSAIPEMLHENFSEELARRMEEEVRRIADQDPRLEILNVGAASDGNSVTVGVRLTYKPTGEETTLALAFGGGR